MTKVSLLGKVGGRQYLDVGTKVVRRKSSNNTVTGFDIDSFLENTGRDKNVKSTRSKLVDSLFLALVCNHELFCVADGESLTADDLKWGYASCSPLDEVRYDRDKEGLCTCP